MKPASVREVIWCIRVWIPASQPETIYVTKIPTHHPGTSTRISTRLGRQRRLYSTGWESKCGSGSSQATFPFIQSSFPQGILLTLLLSSQASVGLIPMQTTTLRENKKEERRKVKVKGLWYLLYGKQSIMLKKAHLPEKKKKSTMRKWTQLVSE